MRYESEPFALDLNETLWRAVRPVGRRLFVFATVLVIILVSTLLLFELFMQIRLQWVGALRLGLLIYLLFGVMFVTILYGTWRNYRLPKNAAIFEKRRIAFDEEAFEIHAANGIFSRVPWKAVVSAKHADRMVLLSVSASQTIGIPDGVFSSDGQSELLDRVARLPG